MDDLLTTRQVINILKVDRLTIYRMLQDGRIKGAKIGEQWRFQRSEVDRILGVDPTSPELIQTRTDPTGFPIHCIQTVQDLFSDIGQVSALVIDTEGEPITQISHPCRYCQIIQQNLPGQVACRASWKEIAKQSKSGGRYFTCHAGLQYISAPILNNEKIAGYFLTGEFHWQTPDPHEEVDRSQRIASALEIPVETLTQAIGAIPVIDPEKHTRVEGWPVAAAKAIQTILQERLGFMDRLKQIADLTKIQ